MSRFQNQALLKLSNINMMLFAIGILGVLGMNGIEAATDAFNQCWIAPLDSGSSPTYNSACCYSLTMDDIDLLNGIYSSRGKSFFPGMDCLSQFNRTVSISWLENMFDDNPTLAMALLKNIPIEDGGDVRHSFYKEWNKAMSKNQSIQIHVDQLDYRMVKQAHDLDGYVCQKGGPYDDSHCILKQADIDVIGRNTFSKGLCPSLPISWMPVMGSNSSETQEDGQMPVSYSEIPYFSSNHAGEYERMLISIKPQCFSQFPPSIQQDLGGLYVGLHLSKSGKNIPQEAIINSTSTDKFDIFSVLSNFFHFNLTDWNGKHHNSSDATDATCPGTVGADGIMTVQVYSTVTADQPTTSSSTNPSTTPCQPPTVTTVVTSTVTGSTSTSSSQITTQPSTWYPQILTVTVTETATLTQPCAPLNTTTLSPTCSIITITNSGSSNNKSSTINSQCTLVTITNGQNKPTNSTGTTTQCTVTVVVHPDTNVTRTVTSATSTDPSTSIASTVTANSTIPISTSVNPPSTEAPAPTTNTISTVYSNATSYTTTKTYSISPTDGNANTNCSGGQVVDVITDTVYQNKTQEYRIYHYGSPDELEAILNQGTTSSAESIYTRGFGLFMTVFIGTLVFPATCGLF
jgi:hypothetical protein